jgi:hypothetical protein
MTRGTGKEMLCRAYADCCFGNTIVDGLLAAFQKKNENMQV